MRRDSGLCGLLQMTLMKSVVRVGIEYMCVNER